MLMRELIFAAIGLRAVFVVAYSVQGITSVVTPSLSTVSVNRVAINFLAGNVVVALSIYRFFEPPLFMSDAGIIWDYDKAVFQQHDRYENPHYYTNTKRYGLESLLLSKRRTMTK